MLCWYLGRRDTLAADVFAEKLDRATAARFQASTSAFPAYLHSLSYPVGARSDHCVIKKKFNGEGQHDYAPASLIGSEKIAGCGSPDMERLGTSRSSAGISRSQGVSLSGGMLLTA